MKTPGKIHDLRLFRAKQARKKHRICNLCASPFHPKTVFDRYCVYCKTESELLKFSEWLPEMDQELAQKVSA